MNNDKAISFDSVAHVYREVRPGYPQEVYEEIEKYIIFSPTTKILEIGAGDGKATSEMYQRWDSQFTLIEPGPSFCQLLKRRFEETDRVRVINTTFEDFVTNEQFDCMTSATAFHWTDRKLRYKKAARLLKTKGIIALFWNNYSRNDDAIFDEIQELYNLHRPEIAETVDIRESQAKKTEERKKELEDAGMFRLLSHREYVHTKTYTAKGYVNLLKTFSENSTETIETLSAFYSAIEKLIEKSGGLLELPIHVNLEIGENVHNP